MIAGDELYKAFSEAPRPVAITAGSITPERERITDLLLPYTVDPQTARDIPDRLFDRYEISAMLPVLTADAYRYFMPRCIEHAISHPNSGIVDGLVSSLSRLPKYDARISQFTPTERAAVGEFIEYQSQQSSFDADQLKDARGVWNAAV